YYIMGDRLCLDSCLQAAFALSLYQCEDDDDCDEAEEHSPDKGSRITSCCQQTTKSRAQQKAAIEKGTEYTICLATVLCRYGIGDQRAGRWQHCGPSYAFYKAQDHEENRVGNHQVG